MGIIITRGRRVMGMGMGMGMGIVMDMGMAVRVGGRKRGRESGEGGVRRRRIGIISSRASRCGRGEMAGREVEVGRGREREESVYLLSFYSLTISKSEYIGGREAREENMSRG